MTVTADGEDVVFDGEIPTDPSHVYDLLMGALSENGRAIVQFIVDGVDAVQSGKFPETYEKIEVSSLSHDELTLRLVVESMNHLSTAEKNLRLTSGIFYQCPGQKSLREWMNLLTRSTIC